MYGKFQQHLQAQLTEIEQNGLFKKERVIITPQGANVKISDGNEAVLHYHSFSNTHIFNNNLFLLLFSSLFLSVYLNKRYYLIF